MSNCHPLEVVVRDSETHLQADGNIFFNVAFKGLKCHNSNDIIIKKMFNQWQTANDIVINRRRIQTCRAQSVLARYCQQLHLACSGLMSSHPKHNTTVILVITICFYSCNIHEMLKRFFIQCYITIIISYISLVIYGIRRSLNDLCSITEVKQRRARFIIGWVTAWDCQVRYKLVGFREPRKSDGSSDWLWVGRKRTSMDVGTVSIRLNPKKSTTWSTWHIYKVVNDIMNDNRPCCYSRGAIAQ